MSIVQPMIEELKHESRSTRASLERVPDDSFDWKPHEKSMSFGQLASHIADNASWVGSILGQDELVMDPTSYVPWQGKNTADILETFDRNLAQAIEQLTNQPDEKLMQNWSMKMGDQTVFSMPRVAVIRMMILSHMIHHRAQLGVYLRLSNLPVPQCYGPSADETDMAPPA